ncbi:polysaccharide biosynthesis protein [Butyrivibrio sp. XBB1001]|uniref:polysaccharide biosynthesis protein n=1 Tax=Butyrivibrio sp. XBB1001 TaxID=1280682 RepID=UPI00041E335F|nr:nucleoside-diphosphate sugar epimerase/dehydratase [Butyrivibrio sp. XBB1001]
MSKKKEPFNFAKLYRRTGLIVYDVMSIILASYIAVIMRYEFKVDAIPDYFLSPVNKFLPINILLTIVVFYIFKLYDSLWAYAGEREMQNLVMACVVSGVLNAVGLQFFKAHTQAMPQSYYFTYTFLLITLIFISRFSYRFLRSQKHRVENRNNSKAVMIIGAGEAANIIIKEIITSNFSTMSIKCIIDDDSNKWGKYIQGIRVVGGRDRIVECADLYDVDEIIVAIPSVSRPELKKILDICKNTNCKLRSLPGMYQLVNGEVNVSRLRDVEVEDLLGRDPIAVDMDSIAGYVSGKTVMVTGGGGSIGSELCRQIAGHKPKRLIIVDIYENNAYEIQQELIRAYPELDLVVLIASVRNTLRINSIFEQYKPDIVYHAAAHKHVPLMETSPGEAIKNNVFGTWKTAMAAAMNGTKKFVLISTDKAVNPTNVMGASKRICEMIVQTFNKHYDTEFVAVRFGNVLGSNGSVIPLFKKQIAAGGPVTVTDPKIIRYFMTITEAVSLVLQAGAYAKGGEIFVLDMGEPVKILDLAENLIKLSGYKVGEDIRIEFTGLRPGEKLYEEMLMDEEGLQDTSNKMIHIGKPIEMDEMRFFSQLERLKTAAVEESAEVKSIVQEIVTTYHPTDNEADHTKEHKEALRKVADRINEEE